MIFSTTISHSRIIVIIVRFKTDFYYITDYMIIFNYDNSKSPDENHYRVEKVIDRGDIVFFSLFFRGSDSIRASLKFNP